MKINEGDAVLGEPGELTHGSVDGKRRESKADPIDPGSEPAWARRTRVVIQGRSNLGLARRYWSVLVLIVLLLGLGVFLLSRDRGPDKAALEHQALKTNFSQIQGRVQSIAVQVAALEAAGERSVDKLSAANESITKIGDRLLSMQARLDAAERRIARGAAVPGRAEQPTDPATPTATLADQRESEPDPETEKVRVLVQTFRNIEIRLIEARREGSTIAMDFVVTAADTNTPLRIDNDGVRLNFADGTRHAKYASISTNEWRKTHLAKFALIADIPRRFTVEWADVGTQATQVAVVELSGDLRSSSSKFAMKFKGVTLE